MPVHGIRLLIAIYVDDILLAGKSWILLSKLFQVKDMGKLHYFLGVGCLRPQNWKCMNWRAVIHREWYGSWQENLNSSGYQYQVGERRRQECMGSLLLPMINCTTWPWEVSFIYQLVLDQTLLLCCQYYGQVLCQTNKTALRSCEVYFWYLAEYIALASAVQAAATTCRSEEGRNKVCDYIWRQSVHD